MEPIIKSFFDNDLYKFSVQNFILETFGDNAPVTYQFINRRKEDKFTPEFVKTLREQIDSMADLQVYDGELWNFNDKFPFFKEKYINFLKSYRYDPSQVSVSLDAESQLNLSIKGPWHSTVLWEVPLMSLISELYFKNVQVSGQDLQTYYDNIKSKYTKLKEAGCVFADFGTRRRRSHDLHGMVVRTFAAMDLVEPEEKRHSVFLGTSNVSLGIECVCPIVGSQAHEIFMGMSAYKGLENVNKNTLEGWANVYRGNFGIALTDTYGTKPFLQDFDGYLARLYDGVRQDSGNPLEFADKMIAHYEKLGIDPKTKKIIFSDGLNVDACIKIQQHVNGKTKCIFGIGTSLTNDSINGSRSLNMVIKLRTAFGKEVVKISDNPGKASGDSVALAEAFKVFGV